MNDHTFDSEPALVQIDAARRALARARTVDDVKDIRDKAEAIRVYVRQRDGSLEAQNIAAELKLRAERRLGELLAGRERNRGGNPNLLHDATGCPPTYAEMGIERTQAHRWQQVAALPEADFERHLAETKAAGGELTTGGVVRLAAAARRRRQAVLPVAPVPVALGEGAAEAVLAGSASWSVSAADCLEWFAAQPADSIDLVFGSPPYEMARLYLEGGEDPGVARGTDAWVEWMVKVYKAALRCCRGLVAFVVEGQTSRYRWSASPALLMAALHREGVHLRKPPIYGRVGIPGSGGPDWLRNDYEFVVCATRGGRLRWSDNTAMGRPPKYRPGGAPSHRRKDGSRVNRNGGDYAGMAERADQGPRRAPRRAGGAYRPPARANPGNVIDCGAVGGGNMGDPLCHENEAPFPEALVEFFVKSFCRPGGVVCDPFSGSGTTGAVAVRHGRRFVGCDLRPSQVQLTRRRIANSTPAR